MWSRLGAALRQLTSQPDVRLALRITMVTRGAVFLCGFIALFVLPPHHREPGSVAAELALLPERGDASWYLGIVSGGYRWRGDSSNPRVAFFPGFPLAVRAVASTFRLPNRQGPLLWTGVLVSCACFFVALIYLQRLAVLLGSTTREAAGAAWLAACLPFALFHGQFYSESLFLMCAVLASYHAYRAQWWLAIAFGAAVGAIRPTGILICAALASCVVATLRRRRPDQAGLSWLSAALAIASPFAGLLAYSAYLQSIGGDGLAWLHAQSHWGRGLASPLRPFITVAEWIQTMGLTQAVLAHPYDTANVTAGALGIATAVPVFRRLGWGFSIFCLLSVLIPLAGGGFLCLGRFTAVLFPAFVWLGRTRLASPALLVAMMALEGLLAALFFTDRGIC